MLAAALATATLLYILIVVLSVSAYPEDQGSWLSYIGNLTSDEVFYHNPVFYAAHYYLGNLGTALIVFALLCLVFTSLIGNIVALSRLIYTLAKDEVIPASFAQTTNDGVPTRATMAVALMSIAMPLLGRTAIALIVDVTSLCSTLVYGFVCACALRDGRQRDNLVQKICGALGLVIMVAFGINLLLYAMSSSDSMSTESYLIFTVWSVLGFLVFRWLLAQDTHRRFGKSIFAWIILLALVLCLSAVWMTKISISATHSALTHIVASDLSQTSTNGTVTVSTARLSQVMEEVNTVLGQGAMSIAVFCMFSFTVMLSNFAIVQRREEASHQEAAVASKAANTDPLTGVWSKRAYVTREAELNSLIQDGSLKKLGLVVCDVNNLKQINDTRGHKAGDEYIQAAVALLRSHFGRSRIYRVGGDEFVVLLQGRDYRNRARIMEEIEVEATRNRLEDKVVVACGLADLRIPEDREVHDVFERADAVMYERKRRLKSMG